MHSLMKKFPPLESKNLNLIIALKLKRVDLIWSMYDAKVQDVLNDSWQLIMCK